MKILASSDIHGSLFAFQKFAQLIREEMMMLLKLTPDDLLEELAPEGETYLQTLERRAKELHDPNGNFMKCLKLKEMEIRAILAVAGKPIFVIKGNHDLTDWASGGNLLNIHARKVQLQGCQIVGYQHTEFNRRPDQQRRDFRVLGRHLDKKTILVTHIPAKGALDVDPDDYSYGSEPLAELLRVKPIALHVHGHVHGRFGFQRRTVNAAYPKQRAFVSIDLEAGKLGLLKWQRRPTTAGHRFLRRQATPRGSRPSPRSRAPARFPS